jgi:Mrp family chromosome partitioning ATPase
MDGLTSDRMRRILDEASRRFDLVILEVPPIGPVPDAGLLASMVDAVLFVVRAGVTPHGQLQKAIEAVGRDRIFGVVLNGARSRFVR